MRIRDWSSDVCSSDLDMGAPGRAPMPGIVAHRSLLGGLSQRIGNPLGGALVIGREGDPDMAVVEDRIIFAISLLDLVERLGDQEGADAIAGHEGKAGLEEVEPPERRKLVQHHQELVLAVAVPDAFELLGQAAADRKSPRLNSATNAHLVC